LLPVHTTFQNGCAPGEEPVTASDLDVVAALEHAIVQRIGEPRYNLWFAQHTKMSWDGGQILVGVPNHFFQEWLQKTFAETVREAASEIFDQPMEVRFAIDPELFRAARRAQEAGKPLPPVNPESEENDRRPRSRADRADGGTAPLSRTNADSATVGHSTRRPRQWRGLHDFVVGPCNRVAHASAQSVVENPAQEGNPLVLHGPVGTGKTHLLEGIYAGLRKKHPEWRVCFTTSEQFTNRFLQAMHGGKLTAFRHHFRDCDALLIDDVHFLAKKKATQEEFLHTFDALQAAGRQVVMTCDCHPRLADELCPELADRLMGGAIWPLSPPDPDTRMNLLRSKAARDELPMREDVLRLLAGQLRGNVRELEGALHSLRHFSRVAGRPVDLALAREALGDLLRHAVRVVHLPDVDRAVCQALRLEQGALQSRQRSWAVSHPRMLAIFLARRHTAAAYSEIGQYFGGRNHSTAVAAEKKVRHWIKDKGELTLGERRLPVREVVALVERELFR
jgi:chromosomal replication initiator protein